MSIITLTVGLDLLHRRRAKAIKTESFSTDPNGHDATTEASASGNIAIITFPLSYISCIDNHNSGYL